jgi:hypothetical protein
MRLITAHTTMLANETLNNPDRIKNSVSTLLSAFSS